MKVIAPDLAASLASLLEICLRLIGSLWARSDDLTKPLDRIWETMKESMLSEHALSNFCLRELGSVFFKEASIEESRFSIFCILRSKFEIEVCVVGIWEEVAASIAARMNSDLDSLPRSESILERRDLGILIEMGMRLLLLILILL